MTPEGGGRAPEAGVTLVEMLVALAIFALVGLASFGLLDAVIGARDRTEGRLEAVAALDRALILFGRDLGQGDPGSLALSDGVLAFGLLAAGGPEEMAYALDQGALERRAGPVEQRLVDGIAALAWRVLDREGAWHEAWPPEGLAEGDEAPPSLAGVEMRLTLDGGGGRGLGANGVAPSVRRLVELPLGVPPPPAPLALVLDGEEAG